jgi:hypothetical protein
MAYCDEWGLSLPGGGGKPRVRSWGLARKRECVGRCVQAESAKGSSTLARVIDGLLSPEQSTNRRHTYEGEEK